MVVGLPLYDWSLFVVRTYRPAVPRSKTVPECDLSLNERGIVSKVIVFSELLASHISKVWGATLMFDFSFSSSIVKIIIGFEIIC